MIISRFAVAAGGLALIVAASLTGCSSASPSNVVAPITKSTDELQGSTVELPLNTVLNITTGSLAVDSYSATIADPSIASFVQGHTDGSATFNPGITPLKIGETTVTLKNSQGGIQDVKFTLDVVAAP